MKDTKIDQINRTQWDNLSTKIKKIYNNRPSLSTIAFYLATIAFYLASATLILSLFIAYNVSNNNSNQTTDIINNNHIGKINSYND